MKIGAVISYAAAILLSACASAPAVAPRAGVNFVGALERAGTERARYQSLILDLAAVWANCDGALMRQTLSADVDFSYPTNRVKGIDAAVADLDGFCKTATDRSIYFPTDAFYIDTANRRVAAEVQFRVTQGGKRQVVNDVWIATIRDGKIAIIKEYLDGRVRGLQTEGVLTFGEDAPFLTPWPPRVQPLKIGRVMHHHLPATPHTVRFGMFDAAFPPVLTVRSGDSVTIECVSGGLEVMPIAASGLKIPQALQAIHHAKLERIGPHILTGPIAIEGAAPGDVLEVCIDAIEPNNDWGYCAVRPLAGTLPDEFPELTVSHIAVDLAAGSCKPEWGPELPLAPFFGTMGVAPPARYGRLSSREPREHGGNIDNKELVAGARLRLPVWVDGAGFSVGDGHGRQGDGEVCVNALEMGLTGTFTFILHKNAGETFPRAETPRHYITMGFNETLDGAMKLALRRMIDFIVERGGLSRVHAYQFCSLAVDFRVTQTVNGEKGVHAMLEKGVLFT